MKFFFLYTLLFFIFSSCSSEKILFEKIKHKKWHISYVKSNLGRSLSINEQDKESLNTKGYKSKNLISETEQFLASNDELIEFNKEELSTIPKENSIYKRFTTIDSIENSNNSILKENEIFEESRNALTFSLLTLFTSIISLLLGFIGVIFAVLIGSEILAKTLIYFLGGGHFILASLILFSVNSIYRILKKKDEKIKTQEKKIKRALYTSMIISISLLLFIPIVIYLALKELSFWI